MENTVKIIGKRIKHTKGFSDALNDFLRSMIEFRKDTPFIPRGVFRFKTFEEAEQWRHKMLRGKRPDRLQ